MKFLLTGDPQSQTRHRHFRKGRQILVFDPKGSDKKKLKEHILFQMLAKAYSRLSNCAIYVKVSVHTAPPSSWSRKRRIEAEGQPKVTKPDIDNIVKLYFDVMNGIVYDDDRQISIVRAAKFYSSNPRVEITITPWRQMPFKSLKQKKYLYMNEPEVAKEFAAHTPKGAKLPEKVKKPKKTKPKSK